MIRRLLRYSLRVLSALLLVLCVATVVLWVRSYSTGVRLFWGEGQQHSYLCVVRGRASFIRIREAGPSMFKDGFRYSESSTADLPPTGDKEVLWSCGPFGRYRYELRPMPTRDTLRYAPAGEPDPVGDLIDPPAYVEEEARWPLWAFALPLLLGACTPVPWLAARWRWRSCHGGLCPICGYDLRATPGRCPECGIVPAATTVV